MKKKEHVEDVDAAAAADDADLSSAARKALLQAVEGTHNDEDEALHSPRRFLSLFVSSNCSTSLRPGLSLRVQKQILYETIADLHKATARRFFGALQSLVRAATQPKAVETDAQAQDALFYAATAVQAYVRGQAASTHNTHSSNNNNTHSSNKRILLIEEVGVVAQFLHDVIFDLDHAPEAQTAIVAMCEAFWKANITGRENLVPQAIPQLVYSAATVTEETMFKKDMTRLYNIREALTIIDFADVSSDEVRRSLLSLASSPLCLKHAEGIKLLAFILQCDDETLQKDMHLAIRAQMTQQKKNMVRVYGEVYLKAWKLALDSEEEEEESQSSHTNSARMHVEEMMEQYAYSMIHAKHTTLNKSLSIFMEPFYQQQKTPAVEDLLHRIYGPILWRATAAANSQVRVNAVKVLAQVFPLQDASHNHTEQAVRQACTALTTLLKDDQPAVRMAAAEAVGKVMTEFWDVLPPATIRSFLNYLIREHASDMASSGVRVAAVNAIALILQAPQSHAVLRPLLPFIGNLIHDKVEKVRLAVTNMLQRIKNLKGIKYHHVVPVDHLTSRMALEGQGSLNGQMASALTGLMANAYFPQGDSVSGVVQIQRTLTFLAKDPMAATVFYSNISKHISVNAVVKLIAMLLGCLNSAIRTDQKADSDETQGNKRRRQVGSDADSSDDEEEQADQTLLSASNTALMASIAETINVLWQSIDAELELKEHDQRQQILIEKFSGETIMTILTHFEGKAQHAVAQGNEKVTTIQEDCHRVYSAILRCAGRLPLKAVEGLLPHVSAALAKFSDGTEGSNLSTKQATAFIALLCLWGMTDEVGTSLAASIESTFERDHALNYEQPSSKQGSRKRRAGGRSSSNKDETVVVPDLPPIVALQVLGDILSGADPSSLAARQSLINSDMASKAIEKALQRGTKYAERVLTGTTVGSFNEVELEIILRACETYGRFVLHKEAVVDVVVSFSDYAQQLLEWTTKRVLPAFSLSPEDIGFDDNAPASNIAGSPMSPVPTGPARRRTNRNATPCKDSDSMAPSDLQSTSHRDKVSAVLVARAFGTSLLQASCVIFSEWLAVGCAGADAIAKAAVVWTKIFCIDEVGTEAQTELLPAFCRLALYLARNAQDTSLLKSLLLECTEDSTTDNSSLQKVLSLLFASRNPDLISAAVEAIFQAANGIVERLGDNTSKSSELPASVDTLWNQSQGCIKPAVAAVLSSKSACLELAKLVVNELNNSNDSSADALLFKVKCLWLVCDVSSNNNHSEVLNVVRGLRMDNDSSNDELRSAVEELLGGISS